MWNEEDHPREPKGTSGGGRFIARVKNADELVDYVRMVLNGEEVPNKVVVCDIGDRERAKIEELTGEPLGALYHTLSESEVRHIEKRHGTNGKHDSTMKEVGEYGKIIDTLQNFDQVELVVENGVIQRCKRYVDKNGECAKLIQFKKKQLDKSMVVVEAITDTKSKDILIMSVRQTKKGG